MTIPLIILFIVCEDWKGDGRCAGVCFVSVVKKADAPRRLYFARVDILWTLCELVLNGAARGGCEGYFLDFRLYL